MSARRLILRSLAGLLAARARRGLGMLPRKRRSPSANAIFDREALGSYAREKVLLESFDLYLYMALNEPRLVGQIQFEYGALLNAGLDWRGLRVLDLGTGRSTVPRWFAAQGSSVVTFDLPARAETKLGGKLGSLNRRLAPRTEVREVAGSFLDLPFADASFDLVTSFSVLEHLDTAFPDLAYVPYEEQKRRLAQSLDEMVRVTRPGGHLYITSDCCDYGRATADAWRDSYYFRNGPDLSGAWPAEDVTALFYEYLAARGCPPAGPVSFDPARIAESRCATFRGPYFSAFSVLARKEEASDTHSQSFSPWEKAPE